MFICDVCACMSLMDVTRCRCNHYFCDECAHVSCGEDGPKFSSCTFCPKCVVDCDTGKREEEASKAPPPPPPKPEPPSGFVCPITKDLMKDPVVLSDGFSYERESAVEWMLRRMVSPITGMAIVNAYTTNTTLRVLINEWKEQHGVYDD